MTAATFREALIGAFYATSTTFMAMPRCRGLSSPRAVTLLLLLAVNACTALGALHKGLTRAAESSAEGGKHSGRVVEQKGHTAAPAAARAWHMAFRAHKGVPLLPPFCPLLRFCSLRWEALQLWPGGLTAAAVGHAVPLPPGAMSKRPCCWTSAEPAHRPPHELCCCARDPWRRTWSKVGEKALPKEYVVLGNSILPSGPGHVLALSWKEDKNSAPAKAQKEYTFTTEAYFTPNGGK